jgi:glutamate/tyrosine decarboxylase-like PLP-dependent enzyme
MDTTIQQLAQLDLILVLHSSACVMELLLLTMVNAYLSREELLEHNVTEIISHSMENASQLKHVIQRLPRCSSSSKQLLNILLMTLLMMEIKQFSMTM